MSVNEFSKWMERSGKTPLEVAVEAKLSPSTVYRFLQNKPVQRGTLVVLEMYYSRFAGKARAAAV